MHDNGAERREALCLSKVHAFLLLDVSVFGSLTYAKWIEICPGRQYQSPVNPRL